jgi:hypothetical protein
LLFDAKKYLLGILQLWAVVFTHLFGECRLGCLNIHYCQVAGYPAAWRYPWHLALSGLGGHGRFIFNDYGSFRILALRSG